MINQSCVAVIYALLTQVDGEKIYWVSVLMLKKLTHTQIAFKGNWFCDQHSLDSRLFLICFWFNFKVLIFYSLFFLIKKILRFRIKNQEFPTTFHASSIKQKRFFLLLFEVCWRVPSGEMIHNSWCWTDPWYLTNFSLPPKELQT